MNMKHSAPFIHTEMNDSYISIVHLISLIPVMAVAVVYYGVRAAILILFCAGVFAASDDICTRVRDHRHDSYLSSLFYGSAFALLLPPDTPLYIALAGVLFGSIVIRQLSGGRGSALINPAAAARLFIRIVFPDNECALSFPGQSRTYIRSLLIGSRGIAGFDINDYYLSELITGRYPSFLGTACAFMMLAGLIYLIAKKAYKFYIPLSYIAMTVMLSLIADAYLDTSNTNMFLLTSGVLFTSAYLLSDDETVRQYGVVSIVQAFFCAVLTVLVSMKTSGIDVIVVPVVVTGVMTGVFDYAERVIRSTWEEKLHVKP